MLAALNINCVSVAKLPKISILTTGDELADVGEELLPGKIRNINSYSLYALALRHGCIPVNLGVARDTKNDLRDKLLSGIKSDMLIISGGVSSGDYDYVRTVLADMGLREIFWKVSVKPGKPVLFGIIGSTLVFGLPGNPVSSMVAFEQFVLPAIYKMKGIRKKPWNELKAVFEGSINKSVGITNFVRGRTFLKDGRIHVKQTGPQSSGMFSSMVLANCLVVIPEDVAEVKNGDEVTIQINDEIGE
jgi:molybdopterin molybdotransferase